LQMLDRGNFDWFFEEFHEFRDYIMRLHASRKAQLAVVDAAKRKQPKRRGSIKSYMSRKSRFSAERKHGVHRSLFQCRPSSRSGADGGCCSHGAATAHPIGSPASPGTADDPSANSVGRSGRNVSSGTPYEGWSDGGGSLPGLQRDSASQVDSSELPSADMREPHTAGCSSSADTTTRGMAFPSHGRLPSRVADESGACVPSSNGDSSACGKQQIQMANKVIQVAKAIEKGARRCSCLAASQLVGFTHAASMPLPSHARVHPEGNIAHSGPPSDESSSRLVRGLPLHSTADITGLMNAANVLPMQSIRSDRATLMRHGDSCSGGASKPASFVGPPSFTLRHTDSLERTSSMLQPKPSCSTGERESFVAGGGVVREPPGRDRACTPYEPPTSRPLARIDSMAAMPTAEPSQGLAGTVQPKLGAHSMSVHNSVSDLQ